MKIKYTILIFLFTFFVNAQVKNIIEKKGDNSDNIYRLGEDGNVANVLVTIKNKYNYTF